MIKSKRMSPNTYPDTLSALRIWTLGVFRMERFDLTQGSYVAVPLIEQGGYYTRLILKLLLCAPSRQLRRAKLLDQLIKIGEQEGTLNDPQKLKALAATRLKQALKSFRTLFICPETSERLFFIEEEIECYRLANQEHIWVDADACIELMDQANASLRTGENPLPLVKKVSDYFQAGMFLEEEEGWWVAGRRGTLDMLRQTCSGLLLDLYEQQGLLWEARTFLQQRLEEDPTDEEALYRLFLVLEKQGNRVEALTIGRNIQERLEEEGMELTGPTRTLLKQVRHAWRENQRQTLAQVQTPPLLLRIQSNELIPSSRSTSFWSPDTLNEEQVVTLALQIVQSSIEGYQWPNEEIQSSVRQAVSGFMKQHERGNTVSRRQALTFLIGATGAVLSIPTALSPTIADEALPFCERNFATCWQLGKGSGDEMLLARTVLSSYLPTLTSFATQPAPSQKKAADLAAQCYRLRAILGYHLENLSVAEKDAKNAVSYSKISGDPDMLVTSLALHAMIL